MSGSAPQDSDSDDELLFVDEEGSVKSSTMKNCSLKFHFRDYFSSVTFFFIFEQLYVAAGKKSMARTQ